MMGDAARMDHMGKIFQELKIFFWRETIHKFNFPSIVQLQQEKFPFLIIVKLNLRIL